MLYLCILYFSYLIIFYCCDRYIVHEICYLLFCLQNALLFSGCKGAKHHFSTALLSPPLLIADCCLLISNKSLSASNKITAGTAELLSPFAPVSCIKPVNLKENVKLNCRKCRN